MGTEYFIVVTGLILLFHRKEDHYEKGKTKPAS